MTKDKVVTIQPKKIYGRPKVLCPKDKIKEAIVDSLFKKGQIHLFGGASGVGKSRLAIPMLERIKNGELVFGHESHATDFVYVAVDRDYNTARALIFDLGFDADSWNIFSLLEDALFQEMEFKRILENYIIPQFPNAKLIFVEGMGMLLPNIIDYYAVRKFLHGLLDICHKKEITIIGSVHSPKMKEGERYQLTRENILGSVAWGGVADTIVGFDFAKRENPLDPGRKIVVWPHSFGKQEIFHLSFNDLGVLQQVDDPRMVRARNNKKSKDVFWQFVAEHPGEFVAAELIDYAEKCQTSRTDIFGLLKDSVEEGRVEKLRHGKYRVRQIDALDFTPLDEEALRDPRRG